MQLLAVNGCRRAIKLPWLNLGRGFLFDSELEPQTSIVSPEGQNILDSNTDCNRNLRIMIYREVSGIHKPAQTSFGAQPEFTYERS